MMPLTLTLIRHGESESNIAKKLSEAGRAHPNEDKLMNTHTSRRRLTQLGVKQAIQAGSWLRDYLSQDSTGAIGYVSPYIRAMETAGNLDLPITWRIEPRLAERNWGDLDQLTHEERQAKYGSMLNARERDGLFWPAGNGETLQMLATRVWQHFDMLSREHENDHVIEVSHGETILTQRFLIERLLPEDVVHLLISTDTVLAKNLLGMETDWQNKIVNCRIIQYTRKNENSESPYYSRVRMIAPSDPTNPRMNLDWHPIVRKTFTTQSLLEYVEKFPHFLR